MLRAEGFEFETSIGSLMSLVSKHTQSKIHKKKNFKDPKYNSGAVRDGVCL